MFEGDHAGHLDRLGLAGCRSRFDAGAGVLDVSHWTQFTFALSSDHDRFLSDKDKPMSRHTLMESLPSELPVVLVDMQSVMAIICRERLKRLGK